MRNVHAVHAGNDSGNATQGLMTARDRGFVGHALGTHVDAAKGCAQARASEGRCGCASKHTHAQRCLLAEA